MRLVPLHANLCVNEARIDIAYAKQFKFGRFVRRNNWRDAFRDDSIFEMHKSLSIRENRLRTGGTTYQFIFLLIMHDETVSALVVRTLNH